MRVKECNFAFYKIFLVAFNKNYWNDPYNFIWHLFDYGNFCFDEKSEILLGLLRLNNNNFIKDHWIFVDLTDRIYWNLL